MNTQETANYAIEELHHALDAASAIVYLNWNVRGDAWNQVSLCNQSNDKSIDVFQSKKVNSSLTVVFWNKSNLQFNIDIPAEKNVVGCVLLPMIEQFMQGDRKEIKDALNPILKISPAII